MPRAKAYWRVFVSGMKEDGANPQRLISGLVQNFIRIWLVIVIYGVAYKFNAHPGLSFANTIWTFGLFFAFVLNLGIRNVARLIDLEVKLGSIETSLIKPLDFRLVKLCQLLGKSTLEFILQLIILPITMLVFVGPPDVSFMTPAIFAGLALLLVFSMIIPACLFTMIGLTAVWTNDAMPIFRIIDKTSAVLTGSFVPVALLPGVMQEVLRWSPFGIYAAPQMFFNPHTPSILVPTLLSGLLWVGLMFLFTQLMWRRVQRKLEVNGG